MKKFTYGNTPIMVDQLIEGMNKDLKRISKREQKLNTSNEEQISQIQVYNSQKTKVVDELKRLATSNQ